MKKTVDNCFIIFDNATLFFYFFCLRESLINLPKDLAYFPELGSFSFFLPFSTYFSDRIQLDKFYFFFFFFFVSSFKVSLSYLLQDILITNGCVSACLKTTYLRIFGYGFYEFLPFNSSHSCPIINRLFYYFRSNPNTILS